MHLENWNISGFNKIDPSLHRIFLVKYPHDILISGCNSCRVNWEKVEIQCYFILLNTLFFVDVKYDSIDVQWWALQENKPISISESNWKL